MSDATTILIVDDDPLLVSLLASHAEALGYQTLTATNGQEARTILEEQPESVDLILSDVQMPVMDGYQFSKWVTENDATHDIPLIFISAMVSLEEQLRGYDAGADDYITKPILPEVLARKIKNLLEIRENNRRLGQQANDNFNTAMQAMVYSSQLGEIIEFFKKSLETRSLKDIAALLFEFMGAHELRCTIQFHTPLGVETLGDQGEVAPLELSVMELSRDQPRFFDFGARTIVNYKDFSFLIKNMPVDDPDKYGTLKDILGNLGEVIASRVNALLVDDTNRHREQVLLTVQTVLDDITVSLDEIHNANVQAIESMIHDTDMAMLSLGLSEEQEGIIRKIAEDCLEKVEVSFDRTAELKTEFSQVKNRLSSIFSGDGSE